MVNRAELERDLYALAGREFHELAWRNDYPLHNGVAIQALLEGFNDFGIPTRVDKDGAFFDFFVNLGGSPYTFSERLTFDELSKGWNNKPASCPRSLYEAIYLVYDKVEEKIKRDPNAEPFSHLSGDIYANHFWQQKRNVEPREIRKRMEKHLLDAFAKYHENIFLATTGQIPELKEPTIVRRVFSTFPFRLLEDSILLDLRYGPTENGLMDMTTEDWNEFDHNYHPSESVLVSYFLGHCYDLLREEKGYPFMKGYGRKSLKDLVCTGPRALERGDRIKWGAA